MKALEFTGSQALCKVFTADLEPTAEAQIHGFLDCPAFAGCQIRIMPDVHAGAGAVIGFTSPTGPGICPNVIGVDIGCGVMALPLADKPIDFPSFDECVRRVVPSGFATRDRIYPNLAPLFHGFGLGPDLSEFLKAVEQLSVHIGCDPARAVNSIGTLGGGNHFIEVGKSDKTGMPWLALHSGSRNFGLRVADFHQRIAARRHPEAGSLAWLEGPEAQDYLRDMRLAQVYARLNRLAMADAILRGWTGFRLDEDFEGDFLVESVHNFIDHDNVIRKGAISAKNGEGVVIPWNMRDGMILGRGLGNLDWNESAPHGAGRRMGRMEAKRRLSLDEFKVQMSDVWSSCVGADTLDEAPDAYKPSSEVEAWLGATVEVVDRLRPVYNFKASEERR